MRLLILALCLALATVGQAQQAKAWTYGSFYSAGLLNGGSGDALSVQTVQGAWSKRIFTGLGLGVDWYYARSMPVFADLRFKLRERRSTSFLYADLGANIPVGRQNEDVRSRWYNYNYKGGIYFDAGAGYLFPIRKLGTSVLLTAGYSQKSVRETQTLKPEFDNDQIGPWWGAKKYETDFILRRWSFKLGFAL
jgi:hypothetical protein